MTRKELLDLLDQNAKEAVTEVAYPLHMKALSGESLTGTEVAVLVPALLNMEVLNGGLCQFFVNDGDFAALVPPALRAVGAEDYAALVCDFAQKHGIDLNDLSAFELTLDPDDADFAPYIMLTEKYPFDDFDNAFYELYGTDPLEGYIAGYIREHIGTFAEA